MQAALVRQRGGDELVVWGAVSDRDLEQMLAFGRELLSSREDEIALDMRSASVDGSGFVGTVAQLAMEARALAKTLVLRAAGRTADWLAWSGLQRVARLEVFSGQEPVAAGSDPSGEGDLLP
jgi:hypothetical protein